MSATMSLEDMKAEKEVLKEAKKAAEETPVGEPISCPYCGVSILKSRYNKVFCSNVRTHDKANCKDRYWNRLKGLDYYIDILESSQEE